MSLFLQQIFGSMIGFLIAQLISYVIKKILIIYVIGILSKKEDEE